MYSIILVLKWLQYHKAIYIRVIIDHSVFKKTVYLLVFVLYQMNLVEKSQLAYKYI